LQTIPHTVTKFAVYMT